MYTKALAQESTHIRSGIVGELRKDGVLSRVVLSQRLGILPGRLRHHIQHLLRERCIVRVGNMCDEARFALCTPYKPTRPQK
jgi:predicted ArsR family transcriptional regulator